MAPQAQRYPLWVPNLQVMLCPTPPLFPPSERPPHGDDSYVAPIDGSSPYLRPCLHWVARLTLDEWLELRVLKKSIRIDPRTMAAAYRDCFNSAPRRRASTPSTSALTCQELVLRAMNKLGAVGAREVCQRLSKPQRLKFNTAVIRRAMRELVDSGQAEWGDTQESSIQATNATPEQLDLVGGGKCVYSFRELQLALIDLGHKGEILGVAERWPMRDR